MKEVICLGVWRVANQHALNGAVKHLQVVGILDEDESTTTNFM